MVGLEWNENVVLHLVFRISIETDRRPTDRKKNKTTTCIYQLYFLAFIFINNCRIMNLKLDRFCVCWLEQLHSNFQPDLEKKAKALCFHI